MDDNPYASPCEFSREIVPTTDNSARAAICATVDDYLVDRIKTFDFADRLDGIRGLTADRTAKTAVHVLWHFYSDLEDHLVVLDRRGWNAIQRLVLILKSDAELEFINRYPPHASQAVALVTLLLASVGCLVAWDAWPVCLILTNLVSTVLYFWRRRTLRAWGVPDPWEMWPFMSFAALDRALRSAPDFRKQRYRREIGDRRLRPAHFDLGIPEWVGCWLIGPVVLLFQCLPLQIWGFEAVEPRGHS